MSALERPARPGELCTCGRPARVVYLTEKWGPVGWCGLSDGGRKGQCTFCGVRKGHGELERCPAYRCASDDRDLAKQRQGNEDRVRPG